MEKDSSLNDTQIIDEKKAKKILINFDTISGGGRADEKLMKVKGFEFKWELI